MARKSHGHWPQDLLTPILLRLPVKSILRFKGVSKSWYSLSENPDFVSQHLSIKKKNNNCFLVCHEHPDRYVKVLMKLFLDQTPTPYPNLLPEKQRCVICVHDGLVCLWEITRNISLPTCNYCPELPCLCTESRITISNPAMREFRVLPEYTENMPPKVNSYEHILGFGSTSLSHDYKVIYMRVYVDLETKVGPYHHAAVYRMGTDSWRVLEVEDVEAFRHLYVRNNCNNTCVNGVYYWVADGRHSDLKVLAFQFDNEVFQLIDWPTINDIQDFEVGRLLPLPDDRISLCVPVPFSDVTNRNNRSYDVWVLNDDGQNWTKLLSIGCLPGVLHMLGFCNKKRKDDINKVFVQLLNKKGQLLLYDIETQKFEDVGIKIKEDSLYLELHSYNESLVHCIK